MEGTGYSSGGNGVLQWREWSTPVEGTGYSSGGNGVLQWREWGTPVEGMEYWCNSPVQLVAVVHVEGDYS